MKTSNKLITVAFLLILGSLFVYDHLLKAKYLSGRYKDPYGDYITLKFKDFDTVDVNSTSAVNVKFVQGPFNVRVDNDASDFTKIKQQGNRLEIDAAFKGDYINNPNPYIVIISCPKLTEVNTNAIFKEGNKQIIDTVLREDWRMRQNLIEGFNEDSLSIRQYYGNSIILSGNHIRMLNAVVGLNPHSFSKITILKNNLFQQATIDVLNRSKVLLDGKTIQNLKYHLTDSAQMILTGAAQNIVNNSNPKQK
jgi:hypothetical protein